MDILCDVVMVKLKMLIRKQMFNIIHGPGQEIVHADDTEALLQKTITQVRPDETGRAGN